MADYMQYDANDGQFGGYDAEDGNQGGNQQQQQQQQQSGATQQKSQSAGKKTQNTYPVNVVQVIKGMIFSLTSMT